MLEIGDLVRVNLPGDEFHAREGAVVRLDPWKESPDPSVKVLFGKTKDAKTEVMGVLIEWLEKIG